MLKLKFKHEIESTGKTCTYDPKSCFSFSYFVLLFVCLSSFIDNACSPLLLLCYFGMHLPNMAGLSGLTFRKDLYLASAQIFPQLEESKRPLTRLQERLIKKLGEHAYPFYFELPPHCPASVTLQPAPGDTGKPCGIDYEMKAFVGDGLDDKPHKR